jgi:hypothetical protein
MDLCNADVEHCRRGGLNMIRSMAAWWAAIAVTLLAPFVAEAQTWSEYRPAGGRFRIEMPGNPTVSTEPINLKDGRTVSMVQALIELPDTAYLATYTNYPADIARGTSPATLLTRARDGSAAGGKLRSDKALSVGGHTAREYVIVDKDGNVLVTRSVWANDRLFQMIVVGDEGIEQRPGTRRFLDSFNVVSP